MVNGDPRSLETLSGSWVRRGFKSSPSAQRGGNNVSPASPLLHGDAVVGERSGVSAVTPARGGMARSQRCNGGVVPRARRLRPTPQLRAARGEAQLRREPWAMWLSRSSTWLLVSVPLLRARDVAERAGFEPATHLSARTRFPVALLRPLGHLSVLRSGEGGIRTLDGGIHPHNALAGRRLQPLGHFSAGPRRIADCFPQDGCAGKARPSSARRRRVGASEGAAFSHSATSPRVRAG